MAPLFSFFPPFFFSGLEKKDAALFSSSFFSFLFSFFLS